MSLRPIGVLPAIRSAPSPARELSLDEIQLLKELPYERYLQTAWWHGRRNRALRDVDYRCQRCAGKRELQVHHLSYDHLGAELDRDLEVLCRGCHLGHHFNETQDGIALYMRVISSVLAEGRIRELSDITEEAKERCATLGIPYHHERFHAAVSRLIPRFPFRPPAEHAELYEVNPASEPLNRAEAAGILARMQSAGLIKHMPQVRPLTVREVECGRAAQIIAQAILDQVQRCEDAEREGEKSSS